MRPSNNATELPAYPAAGSPSNTLQPFPSLVGTSVPSNSTSMPGPEDVVLSLHNIERRLNGVSDLSLDDSISQGCYDWAKRCVKERNYRHSGVSGMGENVANTACRESSTDGEVAAHLFGLWMAEKAWFNNGPRFPDCRTSMTQEIGHYSQIMWRRTAKLGVGFFRSGDEAFLVCRYVEPGNVLGQRVY